MKILKVNYETGKYTSGYCDTCDYGSSYITKLSIKTDNYIIKFEFDTMFDYISESTLMQLLLQDYANENVLINTFKKTLDLENIKITFET